MTKDGIDTDDIKMSVCRCGVLFDGVADFCSDDCEAEYYRDNPDECHPDEEDATIDKHRGI
jgi:hypothetical protein